jgi:hypothetical protein
VAAIPHPASFFGVIVALATASLAGPAVAQQPPATQAQVCERPANGASGPSSNKCCCATPAKVACCAVAPEGAHKECFADEFQLVLPLPFRATQAVLSANGALVLGPRTTVRTRAVGEKEVGFGAIANLGEENTLVGADASVGALISDSKVTTLADGVTVNGALTAAGALVVPATAVLKGHVTTNTHTPAVSPPLATVTFTAEPAVNVVGGSTRALAPGRYGETRVEAGATLSLTAGTYYLTSLAVAPGATLALDEKAGAVVVFVKTNVAFAGEERQEGSDGHVLIAAFGCEPSFLSAPFRGTVSAQNAWLSMIAPPKLAFAGRFFANSIDVGAETTIGGLGLTLPGPTQAAGGPPPQPPTPLPKPPPRPGCYEMTPNGWRPVPCATDEFIKSRFPRPDTQLALDTFASQPLVYGQVAVTIPQAASEQNAFLASTAGIEPSCQSTGSPVANQWSVQNNVNDWTIGSGTNAGDQATVQFTIQSNGSTNAVCIWQIDVTSQNYPNKCYSPTPSQRSGGLQAFDFGNIAASTGGGNVSMVASMSWVPSGQSNTYAVVAADAFDMASNWTNVGGGLIGLGACSQAQFASAEVVTQVAASTCANDTDATSSTCAPPTLQPNASAFVGALGTVETNNLTAIGSPSVAYANSDLAVTSITGTTSGSCLGPSHAYVKDSVNDFGATPSTLGDAVFWESPDIFLVPHGTPVTLNAVSTETTITPGGQYDIWVRVHNDLGCSDVTNVKTLVYLADPAALSIQWAPVTNGQYVGNNGSSTGVTAPASSEALIGPLPFTAPTSGIGNGHRCILAAIQADGESAPANQYDAPDSNQVAQRNIQFASPCVFPLTNATTSSGSAQITLTVTPNTAAAPSLTAQPDVEVAFDDSDSSWFNVWTAQTGNGSTFKVTHSGATTTVRLGAYSVGLNQVSLAAGQSRNATGTTVLPSGYPTALTLQIGATLTETTGSGTVLVQNGGSCVTPPPPVIQEPK